MYEMTKNKKLLLSLLIMVGVFLMISNSCKKKDANNNTTPTAITVTDIDGNVYHTVTIGTQVWMVENLKTTKYRDGTDIPIVIDKTAWNNLTTGAYSYYDNTVGYVYTYGNLYNWYAVNDPHNICPSGWHIPSSAEWKTLTTYLGGESIAGAKLKDTLHWKDNEATNETGFTALPGGIRNGGSYDYIYYEWFGYWWSSTEYGATDACDIFMEHYRNYAINYQANKNNGLSIRCVKD